MLEPFDLERVIAFSARPRRIAMPEALRSLLEQGRQMQLNEWKAGVFKGKRLVTEVPSDIVGAANIQGPRDSIYFLSDNTVPIMLFYRESDGAHVGHIEKEYVR